LPTQVSSDRTSKNLNDKLNPFELLEFISPAAARASFKRVQGQKYKQRKGNQTDREDRRMRLKEDLDEDDLAVEKVFA
jgi:ribosome biogenesis protein BRX1